MRLPLRAQLTLLYAGPFFVSGAALLAVPLLGARVSVPAGSAAPPEVTAHQPLVGSGVSLAVVAVVSLVLGWLIAGRFLRPLRMITATARDISASNLNRRLGLRGRDEFTDLADTLDDLFARLEASFESQRHFVTNASHELRTPLTAERALLQVALADPHATAETLRSTCRDVLALGETQERLIEALLTLATSERGIERREPFDLADIAGRTVQGRRQDAIRVEVALAPAPATGDPNLVESMVANLVDNALRHNVAGGWIEVATGTTGGRAAISVRNTGPVIPPEHLERLFQPFQQLGAQRIGGGHGLGLAIVRAIARAHGATVVPRARPEGGLDIEVSFAGTPANYPRLSGSRGTPG